MNQKRSARKVILLIGWREGKRYKLGRVDTDRVVTDYLEELVTDEEQRLASCTARPYSVESTIEKGEYFIAETVDADEEEALRTQLRSYAGLPLITVDRLHTNSLSFYAAVSVDDPDNIRAFIKKSNPMIVAKPGGLLADFGDSLTKLERPVFAIAETFDLIVYPDRIAILREKPFQALFYEETGLNESIIKWVDKIGTNLPMDAATKAKLASMCQKGSRLRLKLQAIESRGHLANVTIAKLRNELKRLGIPAARFIDAKNLVIPDQYEKQLLEVLNEDLFQGGLSGDDFSAERKSKADVA